MKPFKISTTLIVCAITLLSISNANAAGCSSHIEKNAEIESFSDYKKCIGAIEKELPY